MATWEGGLQGAANGSPGCLWSGGVNQCAQETSDLDLLGIASPTVNCLPGAKDTVARRALK